MSPLEAAASLLVLVNVWLVARRSIWNYAFGIVGTALYGWVFFTAKLYSDMLLQGFFIAVQIYGWQQWTRSAAESGEVIVEDLGAGTRIAWVAGIAVATGLWGEGMHRYTDAALPWWDAAIAMVSVAAQILMSLRKRENWMLWIVANLVSIGVYAVKGLWLTAGLYVILLGLAIWGLVTWTRAERPAIA